jgi:hypothetical protein
MKQYITMQSMQTGGYKILETMDSKFITLRQTISDDFRPDELIEWSMSDSNTAEGNEWVYIRKERGVIALYDVSDSMDETYTGEYLDPAKRFEISVKNFAEILFEWEKLRVSRPDIILIVIHEDNHVSLEADPRVIKEYQDAGYVFDFNKK